jgi:hypothetical protein
MEPVNLNLYLRRAGDHHRSHVSDKGRPGTLLGEGGEEAQDY